MKNRETEGEKKVEREKKGGKEKRKPLYPTPSQFPAKTSGKSCVPAPPGGQSSRDWERAGKALQAIPPPAQECS